MNGIVDPWGGMKQGTNVLRNYAGMKDAYTRTQELEKRTKILEAQEERDQELHPMRKAEQQFKLMQSKVEVAQRMLPNVTQKNYGNFINWMSGSQDVFGGVRIPVEMFKSVEEVGKMSDKDFKTYKAGLDKEAQKMVLEKDFQGFLSRQRKSEESHKSDLRKQEEEEKSRLRREEKAEERKNKAWELKAADTNAIGRIINRELDIKYDEEEGIYFGASEEDLQRATELHRLAEGFFKKGYSHAESVQKAKEAYKRLTEKPEPTPQPSSEKVQSWRNLKPNAISVHSPRKNDMLRKSH